MKFPLLVVLFLLKIRFPKSRPISEIINKRYGRSALKIFRNLQNTSYKKAKCELDHKFLVTCKSYQTKPKFLNFKLYRNALRKSKAYQNFQNKLLNLEINEKSKRLQFLENKLIDDERKFNETFSYLDTILLFMGPLVMISTSPMISPILHLLLNFTRIEDFLPGLEPS